MSITRRTESAVEAHVVDPSVAPSAANGHGANGQGANGQGANGLGANGLGTNGLGANGHLWIDASNGLRANGHAGPMRGRLAAATIGALARLTPYVESEIRGLRYFVEPGAVCVDIGAAGGIYTLALSRLAGPTGMVHSVEPLSFANRHVARILNVGRAANVRQHPVALGAEPGVEIMSVPVGRFGMVTGRSFLDRRTGGPDPNVEFAKRLSVEVTVETLDGLCEREGIDRLDFVKIDVEGAELQVLEGGRHVIESCRPAILVEIEARHAARYRQTPDEVTSWMLSRGYSMYTWRRGWRPAGTIEPTTRNYLFQSSSDLC